jgi:hypothetical protein
MFGASQHEVGDIPVGRMRVLDTRWSGSRISQGDRPAIEASLEDMMTRKKPLPTLRERRNGLPLRVEGDKLYKYPDYCLDFFKEGQVVVGKKLLYF